MKRCTAAVEEYAMAINGAGTHEEVLELLKTVPTVPESMPAMLPFLTTASAKGKKRGKSQDSEDELANGDDEEGGGKKKKRATRQKKEVDPNAPKRPASAYILYQNEARAEMKAKYPDLPYQELLSKLGEQWKNLGDDGQKVGIIILHMSWGSRPADAFLLLSDIMSALEGQGQC